MLFIATSATASFESVKPARLDPEHAKAIAVLHKRQLPQSLICAFGQRGIAAYYKWLAGSDLDALIVVLNDTQVAGAATLSLSPQTVGTRAVKSRLWLYLPWLAFSALIWRKISVKLFRKGQGIEEIGNLAHLHNPQSPELLQIFVAPAGIGQGLGTKMTRMIEHTAKVQGCEGLLVRTDNTPSNKALKFYLKNDFTLIGSHGSNGKELAVYYKAAEALRSSI